MSQAISPEADAPCSPEVHDLHPTKIQSARIMGVRVEAATEENAVRTIVDSAAARRGHWSVTVNLDHLRRYRQEPLAKGLVDDADAIVADGTPLIWAGRIARTPLPERITGSSMIWSICEASSRRGISVFLLGGNPGVAVRAADVLRRRYDGLEIAGTLCPAAGFEYDAAELSRIQLRIEATEPGIVLIGLGFPKQDLLIRHLRSIFPNTTFVGVGISFSIVAGEITRGPQWTHKLGLEWAYRLVQEPRRLARRYLVKGIPFAAQLLGSALRHRYFPRRPDASWGWCTDA